MSVQTLCRLACAGFAALLLLGQVNAARAQQPTPAAISLANEIMEAKGSLKLFEAVIPGVVEQSRNTLLQMNPNLFKDLNDVANALRTEYTPRFAALKNELAKIYASRFTEQELKDTLAFYKTPLGKKILTEDVNIVDRSMATAQDWAIKLNEEVLQRFRAEMRKKGHSL